MTSLLFLPGTVLGTGQTLRTSNNVIRVRLDACMSWFRTHNKGKGLYPQAFPQVREYSFSLYKYNAMCGGRGLRPLGIHARLQSLSTTAVCAYACLLCTGTRYRVPGHVRMYLEEFLGKRAEGRPIKRRSDPVSTAVSCRCLVRHKKVEANTTLHVLLSRHRWSLNKRV